MVAEAAPHPLCEECRRGGTGTESARHRQVHVRAHGKESCVDIHLASLMARLWEVCETTSSCQDHGGRAYVRPTADTAAAAERYLCGELGLEVEKQDGVLWFRLPDQTAMVSPAPSTPAAPPADPNPDLLTDLYHLRDRLATARRRLAEATQGVEHPRMESARGWIGLAEERLTRAMEAHSYAAGRALPRADLVLRAAQVLAFTCLVWPVAVVFAHLTGGSAPWMLSSVVVAVVGVSAAVPTSVRRLRGWLGRRRLATALRIRGLTASSGQPRLALPAALRWLCHELHDVEEQLEQVRSGVGAAARRYLTGHPFRPPDTGAGVQWLRERDEVMAALVSADAALTCALDAIRGWWKEPTG